jgi:hypothetical protein
MLADFPRVKRKIAKDLTAYLRRKGTAGREVVSDWTYFLRREHGRIRDTTLFLCKADALGQAPDTFPRRAGWLLSDLVRL